MFVSFFIRRPVFAGVCCIVLTLAGVLAIPGLPVSQYPDLAPPTVQVTAVYPGASSDVVETAAVAAGGEAGLDVVQQDDAVEPGSRQPGQVVGRIAPDAEQAARPRA